MDGWMDDCVVCWLLLLVLLPAAAAAAAVAAASFQLAPLQITVTVSHFSPIQSSTV
jgi:ABC-type glycerol-3-phosphate transport system substrate-binding protein